MCPSFCSYILLQEFRERANKPPIRPSICSFTFTHYSRFFCRSLESFHFQLSTRCMHFGHSQFLYLWFFDRKTIISLQLLVRLPCVRTFEQHDSQRFFANFFPPFSHRLNDFVCVRAFYASGILNCLAIGGVRASVSVQSQVGWCFFSLYFPYDRIRKLA